MRGLLERRTDGIFRIAMAIDESRLVLYAGGMRSQFGTQVAPAWYTQSSHNIRTEGIIRSSYICSYVQVLAKLVGKLLEICIDRILVLQYSKYKGIL